MSPRPRLILAAIAALSIAACGTLPTQGRRSEHKTPPAQPGSAAQAIPLTGSAPGTEVSPSNQPADLNAPIRADLSQGLNSLPPYRQSAYLDAARKLVNAGRLDDAQAVLGSTDVQGLMPVLVARKRLIQAEIDFGRNDLDSALRYAEAALHIQDIDPTYTAEGLDLEARIQLRQGHALDAAKTWIKRDDYLDDPGALLQNDERIWYALGDLNDLQLQLAESGGVSDALRGWLDLATLYLEFEGDSYGLRTAITQWSNDNHTDEAAKFATHLLGPAPDENLKQIALLLPLSSSFEAAARTVHSGFEAASQGDSDPHRPNVIFYDTGSQPSLAASYAGSAASDGADVIVGPLGKEAVNDLLGSQVPDKPMVLLGSSDERSPPSKVYQFGLAPEPEAQDVAEFMYASGRRRVVALYPDDEWGQRVFNAFAARWKALGGTLAQAQSYSPGASDFSAPIKTLFNLTQSDNRKAFLETVTGLRLKGEPRRRQDIDAVFMAAHPEQGRLIKPQINFYQGLGLPVYSTSDVYAGTPDKVKDTDLDGVIFPEMPWLLNDTTRVDKLKNKLQNAGYSNVSTKLFAFGFDAYRLALLAPGSPLASGAQVDGLTAELSVGPDNRIQQRLEWAKFIHGVPVRIWRR